MHVVHKTNKSPKRAHGKIVLLSAIILISFITKIALAWVTRDTISYFDEWGYYEAAELQLEDPNFVEVFRPSAYICFLTGIFWIFGKSLFAAKAAQVLLSTFSVVLLYGIARRIFSEKVALTAAGIFAFYPNLVAFTHYLWRETFFIFLVLSFFYFLFPVSSNYRRYHTLLAGIIIGLIALTRPDIVSLLLVSFIYFFCTERRWSRTLSKTLILLFGIAIVLFPWTIRNYIFTGRFMLVSADSGKHLWHSLNTMIKYGEDYRIYELFDEPGFYEPGDVIFPGSNRGREINRPESSQSNIVDVYHEEVANALEFVFDNPWLVIKRMWPKFCILWGPNSFVIRHLRLGIYGKNFATGGWPIKIYPPENMALVKAVTLIVTLSYSFVIITGLLGMIFHKPSKKSLSLILYIIFSTAIISFLLGMSRYRLKLMPFIIIFSAYGICHVKEIVKAPDRKLRWLLFCILFALFLAICALYVPILFDIFQQ